MFSTYRPVFLLAVLCCSPMVTAAPDGLPKARTGTFALTNARLVTVTNEVIENGTLVIRDGVIEALGPGSDIQPPDDAEVIDCTGMSVYPGLIDAGTHLGLQEVGSLPETNDSQELGDVTPHVKALTAVNPNSVIIATTRISGVTTALTAPTGGLFSGTAALINLHGYTPGQMAVGFEAVVLNFPTSGRRGAYDRRSQEEIDEAADRALQTLNDVWDEAVLFARIDSAYHAAPDPDRRPEYHPDMEALLPAVRGEAPLLIEVNAARDIKAALNWVQERNIRAVFTGVAEGWRVAEDLAEAGYPCIVGPILSLPTRASDRYDKGYSNAGLLHQAGVKIALRTEETSNVRNLPYHAGFAAAYGLGRDEALRAITIAPAEIFGVSETFGSLEPGKSATLFISSGDPMETQTRVQAVFIDGYLLPMVDRQTRLYDEFLERNPGLTK